MRRPAFAAAALALGGLAAFMPALGGALLALACCAGTRRWQLAAACGLTAAWIVGAFYYPLQWPLTSKAQVLVLAGVALGVLAWTQRRGNTITQAASSSRRADSLPRRAGVALCALGVIAVASMGIWQKQALIRNGRPVLLALAPVDPRSLMQGDYMRLEFALPDVMRQQLEDWDRDDPPRLVVAIDGLGVAVPLRLHDGSAVATGESLIRLAFRQGRWVVVTDAWHFEEGRSRRFEGARYGEFRVGGDGDALLVGLRDGRLGPL